MTYLKMLYVLLILIILAPLNSNAEITSGTESTKKIQPGEAFGFYLENDAQMFGGPGSDQAYSSGFKFSYIYAEDRIPRWANSTVYRLHFLENQISKAKVNFGVSLGHQIYTPGIISQTQLLENDRPYAAWLYLGFATSFKEEHVGHFLELDLGIVGPSALGQEVQNNFHEMIRIPKAKGWSNSLHDEPSLQLFYQKRYKAFKTKTFDFLPFYGADLGNVKIGAHIGGLIRYGLNLPDDFGPSRPSAGDGDSFITPSLASHLIKNSYYLFAGTRGNALVRNIFLDGNTFQTSHRVHKYPFNFETEVGLGTQIYPLNVVWRFIVRSPEFEERSQLNSFASINLIYITN